MLKGANNLVPGQKWCEELSEKAGRQLKPSTYMETNADGNVVAHSFHKCPDIWVCY